jgi:ammonia channel protein AmtB
MNVDDPVEAASVHYINGVWGTLACAIFDRNRGFINNYDHAGHYLGI